jgi:hypothetical protein
MHGECLNFDGNMNDRGYGIISFKGKRYKAHRIAYCNHIRVSIHDIEGLVVRHKCDNPSCVNPSHLEIGTQADNISDMMNRGRHITKRGDESCKSKLTSLQVNEIRLLYVRGSSTHGTYALAKRFGISPSHIGRIIRNNNWK